MSPRRRDCAFGTRSAIISERQPVTTAPFALPAEAPVTVAAPGAARKKDMPAYFAAHGRFGTVMVVAAVVMLASCGAASYFVRDNIVRPASTCAGSSFYDVQAGDNWNTRWKRYMYPPQSGDYGDVSCCAMSNAAVSSQWTSLPESCPAGCSASGNTCSLGGCHGDYEKRAVLFNKCMNNVARAAKCPPHVNDTGRMYAHFSRNSDGDLDRFAADFDPDTGRRAVFLDVDDFLADCFARIDYADQRTTYGPILLGVFLLPTLIWLAVVLEMTLCWKKRATAKKLNTSDKSEKVAAASDTVDGAAAAASEQSITLEDPEAAAGTVADLAADKAAGSAGAFGGVFGGGKPSADAAAAQGAAAAAVAAPPSVPTTAAPKLGARLENSRAALGSGLVLSEMAAKKMKGDGKLAKGLRAFVDSALFGLLKHIVGTWTTLASQQAAFLVPTNRYVTDQILLGGAIVAASLLTPVLFVGRLERTHVLFDGVPAQSDDTPRPRPSAPAPRPAPGARSRGWERTSARRRRRRVVVPPRRCSPSSTRWWRSSPSSPSSSRRRGRRGWWPSRPSTPSRCSTSARRPCCPS